MFETVEDAIKGIFLQWVSGSPPDRGYLYRLFPAKGFYFGESANRNWTKVALIKLSCTGVSLLLMVCVIREVVI